MCTVHLTYASGLKRKNFHHRMYGDMSRFRVQIEHCRASPYVQTKYIHRNTQVSNKSCCFHLKDQHSG